MQVEYLFSEVTGLYGDLSNMKYLEMCGVDVKYTKFDEVPLFVNNDVDAIYIGSMNEESQKLVIDKLYIYKERICELIEKGVVFLVTGNALQIFGKHIISDEEVVTGLNIFDFYTKRSFKKKYHKLFLGKYKNIDVVGFKSDFGLIYDAGDSFISVSRGYGNNIESKFEGVKKNNFYGTMLLGPFLINNPLMIREIFGKKVKLKFEKDVINAYNVRLEEHKVCDI